MKDEAHRCTYAKRVRVSEDGQSDPDRGGVCVCGEGGCTVYWVQCESFPVYYQLWTNRALCRIAVSHSQTFYCYFIFHFLTEEAEKILFRLFLENVSV